MKNLNPKTFSLVIFVAFAISFVSLAVFHHRKIDGLWSALKLAYQSIPVVLLIVTGFVLHAWKWRIFQQWLVPFPNLNGTWQGTIQTTWRYPETGEVPGPIPVILTIKQTFTRISCVMRTAEMTSRSYLADFWLNGDEQIRKLAYSYASAPLPSVTHRSAPHDGTMVFEIIGHPPSGLRGSYWTARKSTGEVTLTFRCRERLEEVPADLGVHPMLSPKSQG